MRRLIQVAMLLTALATPAIAQSGGVGMTSGYLLGPSSFGGALNFHAGLHGAAHTQASRFAFRPNPNLREAVTRHVMADIARNDKGLGAGDGPRPISVVWPGIGRAQHS